MNALNPGILAAVPSCLLKWKRSCRDADFADPPDLIDSEGTRRSQAERIMDKLRAKFGDDAIIKGRSSPR